MMVDMTWLRIQVPDWVHRKLKAAAALAGMTLHDYLNKILEQAAEDDREETE